MNRAETRDLVLVLVVSFLASLTWVLTKGRAIQGDDAIMGLMALKISQGADFPIFFWEAHYSGPIASYLAAPLHWLFDPSPLVLHSVIIPFHLFYCAGMYFLARTWLGQREAMITGLFAVLPFLLSPYSALGGFTESMAFIPWIFLLCLGESTNQPPRFFFGGFLCGIALWVHPLAFPPVLACFICQQRAYGGKALKLSLAGCLLGLLPTIYYNLSQPGATFLRLFSRPSTLDRQAALQLVQSEGIISFFVHVLEKWAIGSYRAFFNIPRYTLSLLGFTPDATVWHHISGLITLFAMLFGLWAFLRYQGKAKMIPLALLGTAVITYCFLVFFALDRYRYLSPILLIVPFGLALGIQTLSFSSSWRITSILVVSVLFLNCLANFWDAKPRYPDYQGLSQFLESTGLVHGYAPYEAAYPLVYLSNERLMYTPAFHEPQYDRNLAYTASVAHAERQGFIFIDPKSAGDFIQRLKKLNCSAKETEWGPIRAFYDLTPDVSIERLRSAKSKQGD